MDYCRNIQTTELFIVFLWLYWQALLFTKVFDDNAQDVAGGPVGNQADFQSQ